MNKILFQIFPLIIITAILWTSTYLLANLYSVSLSLFEGWANRVIFFPILFILCLAAVSLIESIWYVSDYVDHDSGQVDIRALWRSTIFRLNPLGGIVASSLMGVGIIGCANLAEIYRVSAMTWYDSSLWGIEETLFLALVGSWLDVPAIWDNVYFSLWPFVFMVMAVIFKTCPFQRFVQVALAVVIAFYLTRCINLLYPTAGPAFYRKELFDLAGTLCGKGQDMLRLYMAGQVDQNGLMPGTMAMPSLHVGLMAMAVWFLAHNWSWTLWVTMPWFLLVWMSTVMLGWHYALDGIGGIIVIVISTLIARWIVNLWESFGLRFFYQNKFHSR